MMDLIDFNIALQKWRGREKIHTHIIRTSWASVERPFFFLVVHPKLSAYTGKASLWKSLPKPPPSLPQASPKPLGRAGHLWKSLPKPPNHSPSIPKAFPSLPKPPRSNPKHSPSLPKRPQVFPQEELRPAVCACVCVCVCECVCVCVCASLSGSLWANYIHN